MATKTKTIRLSEEDLIKIDIMLMIKRMNFNNFVKFCIYKELSKHNLNQPMILDENEAEKENQKVTIRLTHSSINELKKIAKKKGLPASREAKFRLLATLYDDVYEPSELKKLQVFLNEIKKVGRFFNTSIQQNILIQSEMVEIIGKRLNGVEAVLKRILINNHLRNKNF